MKASESGRDADGSESQNARRPGRRAAWLVWAASVALLCASLIAPERRGAPGDEGSFGEFMLIVAFASFPTVGALIVSRRSNAIGWIYLAVGVSAGLMGVSESLADHALVRGATPAWGVAAAWLQAWMWFPTIGLIVSFAFLLFPDGRLPSPRWRPLAWITATALATISIASALQQRLEGDTYRIDNPLGVLPFKEAEVSLGPVLLLVLGCAVLCVVSLVFRYRAAGQEQRQQLKWFITAAGIFVMVTSLGDILDLPEVLFPFLLMTIPASVGIAILRYRLYDIDVVINRTLVYGALTAILAGSYLLCILVLQRFLPLGAESDIAVAASTLTVAALFRPLRARLQAVIDRRFYRRKYDAARSLAGFSSRLRDEVEIEALTEDMLTVVQQTVQPANASLWLRSVPERSRPA